MSSETKPPENPILDAYFKSFSEILAKNNIIEFSLIVSPDRKALIDWIMLAAPMLEAAALFIIDEQHEQGKPAIPDCIEGVRGLLELCPIDFKSNKN